MADEQFGSFVRAHEAELLRLAYLLCRDTARAEDLVQDTLVRLLRRWRTAGVADHPLAYARKALVNEHLGRRRLRSASERIGPVDDVAVPDRAGEVAERDLMWRLLADLPPRSRAVLVLRYYEELADHDIALIMSCRRSTVRSIAARALQILRAHPMLVTMSEEV